MSKVRNSIEKMCRKHFNEPVLMWDSLARLIGYAEDADDCYLIIKYPDKGVVYHSAVGGYIFLNKLKQQGRIDNCDGKHWNDFIRLDDSLTMHDVPKEKEFLLDVRPNESILLRRKK